MNSSNSMPSSPPEDASSEPGTAPSEDGLTELLIGLLKLCSMIGDPMKVGVCDPVGASTNEVKVVMALAGEGPLAGHDLVHITAMSAMNVSRAIAGAKARGWVEDFNDPENRRRRPVRLTAAGEGAYRQMQPMLHDVAESLLGKLTVRQRREMGHLTDLVLRRIAEWNAAQPQDQAGS
ncbi:DNA-binding MarR family transcriptional regulator [Novosphingobium sp. SG751A]|uniref:MarR family winged helix-turn-helix transcriptional regulator n=1 Tax=Novosphingobium sp. SG751A TaxID=2587000 RepID=UPI0015540BB0|nr:MarR family winged helix-turn-helix transcriptional regulator [Novosphingobium sp. SG751A]NOW47191.1 DNA-binding MarR family transcriptional regulator [Novosphingobium sp. SG751A]